MSKMYVQWSSASCTENSKQSFWSGARNSVIFHDPITCYWFPIRVALPCFSRDCHEWRSSFGSPNGPSVPPEWCVVKCWDETSTWKQFRNDGNHGPCCQGALNRSNWLATRVSYWNSYTGDLSDGVCHCFRLTSISFPPIFMLTCLPFLSSPKMTPKVEFLQNVFLCGIDTT